MKSILYIIFGLVVLGSCSKNSDTPVSPSPTEYVFKFTEIKADKDTFSVNESVKLSAIAQGDGLVYFWKSNQGIILGNGASINFSICHADSSKISCTVSDQYGNSSTLRKTVISYFPRYLIGKK